MMRKDMDSSTGVSYKNKKPNMYSNRKNKIDEELSGLVLKKNKPKEKSSKHNILDDLKQMKELESITYKALIDGVVESYDFATDTEINNIPYKAICLGRGILVDSRFTPDIISGTVIDNNSRLLYFWKKVSEVEDDVDAISSLDKLNTVLNQSNIEAVIVTPIKNNDIVDQDDLTNIVKQNEEKDLTMKTNTKYTKANELLTTLKESGDDGVEVLIDYCKISFAEVFTKSVDGTTSAASDLQNQMVYIISEINKNDLLTPESKNRLIEAIELESIEYHKLLESLTDVTDETKVLLDTKDNTETSWGTIALYTIGVIVAVTAAYTAYRYFEPEDVVLDMSTMSMMDR